MRTGVMCPQDILPVNIQIQIQIQILSMWEINISWFVMTDFPCFPTAAVLISHIPCDSVSSFWYVIQCTLLIGYYDSCYNDVVQLRLSSFSDRVTGKRRHWCLQAFYHSAIKIVYCQHSKVILVHCWHNILVCTCNSLFDIFLPA